MGLLNGTVKLENNYKLWKEMFNSEKLLLTKLFKDIDVNIEHVGSTSVEGLLAKPIIDIAIGINDLNDVNKIINQLQDRYNIKNNKEIKEILLIKENNNETFYLIHILDINSDRYRNMIKFRDILINNEIIKKEYEKLKIELSKKYFNNREMYTKEKNEFIKKVLNEKSTNVC